MVLSYLRSAAVSENDVALANTDPFNREMLAYILRFRDLLPPERSWVLKNAAAAVEPTPSSITRSSDVSEENRPDA
jgi:hypothetical protein